MPMCGRGTRREDREEEVGLGGAQSGPGDTGAALPPAPPAEAARTSATRPSRTPDRGCRSVAAPVSSGSSGAGNGDAADDANSEETEEGSDMSDIDRYCKHEALFSNSKGVNYFLRSMPPLEAPRRTPDDHRCGGGEHFSCSREGETSKTPATAPLTMKAQPERSDSNGDDTPKTVVNYSSLTEREGPEHQNQHSVASFADEAISNATIGTDASRPIHHLLRPGCRSLHTPSTDGNGPVVAGAQRGGEYENMEPRVQNTPAPQAMQANDYDFLQPAHSNLDADTPRVLLRSEGLPTLHERRKHHPHHQKHYHNLQEQSLPADVGPNLHSKATLQYGTVTPGVDLRQEWRHPQYQEQPPQQKQEEERQQGSGSVEEDPPIGRTGASLFPALPTFSPTSFVRAYVGEGTYPWEATLDNRPALVVSCCVAAMNWVVVQFLQYHVLETRDQLGLFVIGTYIIFSTYYMTYYFLERYSLSFARISHDKKFYTIANLIKAGILVSLVPFATSHLGSIIMFDVWDTNTLRNLGCIYTIPDFVSMIVVKRMSWSTWIHHLCVLLFNFFSTMNDYSQENICRCVVVYAAFSTFAYCVNVLLASRFLGVSPNVARVLSFVAVVVYFFCCATNWIWQVYYLRKLLREGHGHWTVYAYMLLICLVIYDDIMLNKWLIHNAKNNAGAAANYREHQHRQQQRRSARSPHRA
ncbi:uncharacterized protein Tco025E_07898 [Trypanosoma conorhini]|uniref:Transmembrane protein n=1 Tax=Trypanosoma conorhini TaxID=83891 RepID=A0A3R7NMD7_9TRYP|nr:uncharacterized protein Tco025E_07898 [Trypanosoma conorhini]RNF04818.1 hypothetical protein Tco025E_07898 [Trypanosoma conorhini]